MEKLAGLKTGMLPQVIFMDIETPGVNGIDAISMASALYPGIYFIAQTVFDDDDKIFEAIKAGASGYLLKHEEGEVLKAAVTNVMKHAGAPMSPAIARKTLQLLSRSNDISKSLKGKVPEHLTTGKKILQ